jgi:hypothetical protein
MCLSFLTDGYHLPSFTWVASLIHVPIILFIHLISVLYFPFLLYFSSLFKSPSIFFHRKTGLEYKRERQRASYELHSQHVKVTFDPVSKNQECRLHTELAAPLVRFLTAIRHVLGSSLARDTGCPEVITRSSVPQRKCRNCTLNWATTTSLHTLPNSLIILITQITCLFKVFRWPTTLKHHH